MDIAELIAETEQLKKKHIESAQKLAEAKELLARILLQLQFLRSPGSDILKIQIKEFLK